MNIALCSVPKESPISGPLRKLLSAIKVSSTQNNYRRSPLTRQKRRRTFAKPTVAARLESEVYREFIRDCEAQDEKVADRLRFIVREHYRNRKRKSEGQEEAEDPGRELYRQMLAEELAPLKAALSHLADITCKVRNLEELLSEISSRDSQKLAGASDQFPQGAPPSLSRAQDGSACLLKQQVELLGRLTPIILSQHRLTRILHVKTGSAYNLLKYVATNPECTPKIQGERRKYLDAMYPTWENQMRAQEEEVEAEVTRLASGLNSEFSLNDPSNGLKQNMVSASQLIADEKELDVAGL